MKIRGPDLSDAMRQALSKVPWPKYENIELNEKALDQLVQKLIEYKHRTGKLLTITPTWFWPNNEETRRVMMANGNNAMTGYKLLFCGSCGWRYPKNAASMGHVNACGNCSKPLCFLQSEDPGELVNHLYRISSPVPDWLIRAKDGVVLISSSHGLETFIMDLRDEVQSATKKFPRPDAILAALMEEAGEVANAVLDRPWNEVYKECIQTAAMALRLALEGDPTLRETRVRRNGDDGDMP